MNITTSYTESSIIFCLNHLYDRLPSVLNILYSRGSSWVSMSNSWSGKSGLEKPLKGFKIMKSHVNLHKIQVISSNIVQKHPQRNPNILYNIAKIK